MATLTYNPKTQRAVIQERRPDAPHRRLTVSVRGVNKRTAETIRLHVEHLANSRRSGQPVPVATAGWLGEVGTGIHGKLAAAGLVEPREADVPVKVAAMSQAYIDRRTDVKPRTRTNFDQMHRELVAFFGADRDARTITKAEGRDWHRKMRATLAESTVATHWKKAKQVFADAVDRGTLPKNPLTGQKAGSFVNDERLFYVTTEVAEKVIGEAPDAEFRAIVGLCRYGGLRCPSEVLRLRWSDVTWSTPGAVGRLLIRSPKTEHHKGRDKRTAPLFPRLEQLLLDLLAVAEEGATHVIAARRNVNHRTLMVKVLDRAGVNQWPRLFQNLRTSYETDLTATVPIHVACAWSGNTEAVAKKHYLQVTDQHFAAAGKALYEALQSGAERGGMERNETQKPSEIRGFRENLYPQGESNPGPISSENLRKSQKALYGALYAYTRAVGRAARKGARRG